MEQRPKWTDASQPSAFRVGVREEQRPSARGQRQFSESWTRNLNYSGACHSFTWQSLPSASFVNWSSATLVTS